MTSKEKVCFAIGSYSKFAVFHLGSAAQVVARLPKILILILTMGLAVYMSVQCMVLVAPQQWR